MRHRQDAHHPALTRRFAEHLEGRVLEELRAVRDLQAEAQVRLVRAVAEHRLGDVNLPTGSIVFATTNLDTDGVGDNIPAHAYNRMTEAVIANPTCDEWLEWSADNGIAPEIMAFAKQTPEVFDCYTDLDTKTKNPYIFNPLTGNTRTFCSPRSLAKASNLVASRDALGTAFLPALAGTVGEAAARQMEALVNLSDTLPTFETIIAAPSKAKVPKSDSVGAMFILAFMLASRVDADSLDAVMTYADRVGEQSFEAYALFITTLASNRAKVGMACKNRSFTAAASKLGRYF